MPVGSLVAQLPHLPPPVLTAYIDTNPANPRNQSSPRGYVTWLKSAGRALEREVRPEMRKELRRELRRVHKYLQSLPAQGRSRVLFSGPHVWEDIRLQVPVREELHWGKPSLQQMAWVLDEHRLRGAVLIKGTGARFFRFWLGTVNEDEKVAFSVDTSDWRRPHLVGPSTGGVSKQSGVQRDRAPARLEAQRQRFSKELARRIVQWSKEEQLNPVVLVGDQKLIDPVLDAMPVSAREEVAVVPKVLSQTSKTDVQRELEPVLRDWEREYEEQRVEELISVHDPDRAVLGIDETLYQLQRGRVLELVIARGLRGTARQCTVCGWVDRSADPVCPLCGSKRRSRTLRTVIPELASAFGVPMEIVAGNAAARLKENGGIGAWLGPAKKPVRKVTVEPAASKSRHRK